MTWCLYYLTTHPEVQENVFAELDKVLGDEDITPQVVSELMWVTNVVMIIIIIIVIIIIPCLLFLVCPPHNHITNITCHHRCGTVWVESSALVPLRKFSLIRSTAGTFAVPFRLLNWKKWQEMFGNEFYVYSKQSSLSLLKIKKVSVSVVLELAPLRNEKISIHVHKT